MLQRVKASTLKMAFHPWRAAELVQSESPRMCCELAVLSPEHLDWKSAPPLRLALLLVNVLSFRTAFPHCTDTTQPHTNNPVIMERGCLVSLFDV